VGENRVSHSIGSKRGGLLGRYGGRAGRVSRKEGQEIAALSGLQKKPTEVVSIQHGGGKRIGPSRKKAPAHSYCEGGEWLTLRNCP